MINFFLSIIAVLIGIGLVIGIHELGHFFLAKYFGVKVLRFSIGFGRPLWKRVIKGTEYVIGMLPIGGYVRLLDERQGEVASSERHLTFNRQACWKRFLIILAGPFFNLLLACLAFWVVFVSGIYLTSPIIGKIVPDSIAAKGGLKPFDRIVQVDEDKTLNWGRVIGAFALKYHETDKLTVKVISATSTTPTSHRLDLRQWTMDNLRPNLITSLGIIPYQPTPAEIEKTSVYVKLSALQAAEKALQQVTFYIYFNLIILWKIMTGVLSLQSLGGPIALLEGLVGAFKQGILVYMLFISWLSVNLAVINLLPIPGLDGSHLVYILFEGIFKKPVSVRVQLLAYRLGIILLSVLMVEVVVNDLLRLLT
jgi:regulator of sigma E protease